MAEADISAEIQNTSAALGGFQTSLNSLASSMSVQASVGCSTGFKMFTGIVVFKNNACRIRFPF